MFIECCISNTLESVKRRKPRLPQKSTTRHYTITTCRVRCLKKMLKVKRPILKRHDHWYISCVCSEHDFAADPLMVFAPPYWQHSPEQRQRSRPQDEGSGELIHTPDFSRVAVGSQYLLLLESLGSNSDFVRWACKLVSTLLQLTGLKMLTLHVLHAMSDR